MSLLHVFDIDVIAITHRLLHTRRIDCRAAEYRDCRTKADFQILNPRVGISSLLPAAALSAPALKLPWCGLDAFRNLKRVQFGCNVILIWLVMNQRTSAISCRARTRSQGNDRASKGLGGGGFISQNGGRAHNAGSLADWYWRSCWKCHQTTSQTILDIQIT